MDAMQKAVKNSEPTRKNHRWVVPLLAFLIPLSTIIILYAHDGVYPFGNSSILYSDMANIYGDYLAHLKEMIYGDQGVLWSWNIGMGYNMYSYFIDNMSSPLNLLLLLVPEGSFTEGLFAVLVLRVGLMGLAAWFFLRKKVASRPFLLVLSCTWGLSGYLVAYFQHVMWMDSLILLPLAVLAVEHLCAGRKVLDWPSLGIVTLSFWCSYYLGYMTALFLALYTIWFTVALLGEGPKRVLLNLLKLALVGVLTFAMLGFALLPSIMSNLDSGSLVSESLAPYYGFADITYSLFIGNLDSYAPGGRVPLYCGLFVVYALFLYFMNQDIPRKEKLWTAGMLVVCYLSLACAPIYYAWHMFDQPDWFEGRFTFCFAFFFIIIAVRLLPHLSAVKQRHIWIACAALLSLLAFDTAAISLCDGSGATYLLTNGAHNASMSTGMIILNAGVIIAEAIGFSAWRAGRIATCKTAERILAGLCILELAIGAWATNRIAVGSLEPLHERSEYTETRSQTESVLDSVESQDDDFFRVEKTYHSSDNDALSDDYRGVTLFGSGYNPRLTGTLHSLGLRSLYKHTRYEGSTPVVDSLLGISYVLEQDDGETGDAYIQRYYTKTCDEDGVSAYRNDLSLPLACVVSNNLATMDDSFASDPFDLQNRIVKAAFNTSENCFVRIDDVSIESYGCTWSDNGDGTLALSRDSDAQDAYLDISVASQDEETLFGYAAPTTVDQALEFSTYDAESASYVSQTPDYQGMQPERSYQLYRNPETGQSTLRVTLHADSSTLTSPVVYRFDESAYQSAFEAQKQNDQGTSIEAEGNKLTVHTSAASGQTLLYTSIPYDTGWTATVNGQSATVEPLLGGLCSVEVPEGTDEVVFEYRPTGFDEGCLLSCAGLAVVAAWAVIDGTRAIRRRREPSGRHAR